ncbi:MAG: hypothetical protein LIP10_13360 [Clostridiales bacterium]|nr:hypothetical protein [Clostridiales bacterium]
MNFMEGQGVLGRIRFVDGEFPAYDRTYLVVTANTDYIEVLNVSSIRGKERKLAFSTNERLRLYNPPFVMPSFVKLDSLTRVDHSDWVNLKILNSGKTLDKAELSRIKRML